MIQEIVSRGQWASGNALAVIITGSGHRTAESYNGSPSQSPLLHVEYLFVPPPENPPVAHLSVVQAASPPRTVIADASASRITSYNVCYTKLLRTRAPAKRSLG